MISLFSKEDFLAKYNIYEGDYVEAIKNVHINKYKEKYFYVDTTFNERLKVKIDENSNIIGVNIIY